MQKPKRTYQKPLKLDMSFEEALERFGSVDASELPDNIKLSQKRRTPPKRKGNQAAQATDKTK